MQKDGEHTLHEEEAYAHQLKEVEKVFSKKGYQLAAIDNPSNGKYFFDDNTSTQIGK